jgi:hypothetical protein
MIHAVLIKLLTRFLLFIVIMFASIKVDENGF